MSDHVISAEVFFCFVLYFEIDKDRRWLEFQSLFTENNEDSIDWNRMETKRQFQWYPHIC